MRLVEIRASWFRGAAHLAKLNVGNISCAVYGANGSGKSTFVDGIEYILAGGRVDHLATEYSGKRQEKALINTHAPESATPFVALTLENATVRADLDKSGHVSFQNASAVGGWDFKRLVLRQNEVSDFVHASKGEKYSELLPLIGLDYLDNVAANLRALSRKVREICDLVHLQGRYQQLIADRRAVLPPR